MEIIWDDLAVVDDDFMCNDCSVSTNDITKKEHHKLIPFLIGLNESYAAICSNMLMLTPLPTVN